MKISRLAVSLVAVGAIVGSSTESVADVVYDLTAFGSSGTDGTAIYRQYTQQPTGTGIFPAFVQVTGTPKTVVEAFNTTGSGLDNGGAANFNHEITFGSVGQINLDGTLYRGFLLDINQNKVQPAYYTLDEVQIFTSNIANQSVIDSPGAGVLGLLSSTLRYRLDNVGDNTVLLDYALNNGSGAGDMVLLVKETAFAGVSNSDFVYLYSRFGGDTISGLTAAAKNGTHTNNDGFEEWAKFDVKPVVCEETTPGSCGPPVTDIPEPGSVLLVGAALLGLAASRKRWRA